MIKLQVHPGQQMDVLPTLRKKNAGLSLTAALGNSSQPSPSLPADPAFLLGADEKPGCARAMWGPGGTGLWLSKLTEHMR